MYRGKNTANTCWRRILFGSNINYGKSPLKKYGRRFHYSELNFEKKI
jgi:hypothetical protein